MSGFLNTLRTTSNFVSASNSAYDTDGAATTSRGVLASAIDDMEGFFSAGSVISIRDAPAYLDAIKNLNGVGLDDREFLLEKLVLLMSKLSREPGALGQKMEHFFIDTLFKDLPHPPSNFMGPLDMSPSKAPVPEKPSYAFRPDDAHGYNQQFPQLGRAGQPYARTVPSSLTIPPSGLPDPGLVFDLLLKRDPNETPRAHPGGLSSMFFALANLVIHSIFDTDHSDWRINNAPSYMSLNPLYGGNAGRGAQTVEQMRKLDGTGKIWEDTFADYRLLFMPPATAALLILLNRNHNYIAEKMLDINENRTFKDPATLDDVAKRKQDDEIFHRSRLVNSSYFAKIVLHDYVGGILGLTRDCSAWRLNLTQTIRTSDHDFAPTGEGGAVSIEFNSLYRWHATTSTTDAKWIEGVFKQMFGDKPAAEVTVDDFKKGAAGFMMKNPDFKQWTFGGFQRGPDGRFRDEDLANTILAATDVPAHPFGALGTPECMRVIEILSIEQGRAWGTCSLNEFRKYFGLKPWASFKEWNPDPKIYDAAQALYGHIDNLELHVGLQAEAAKPPMPGAGLCPGYTCSRAILADAVVLTRSDRFLTTELTPFNLTAWGYNFVTVDPEDGSFGGMLSKLLLRELPVWYQPGNGYAHFPTYVPQTMQTYIKKNGPQFVHRYTWDRPGKTGTVNPASIHPSKTYDARLNQLVKGVKIDRDLVDDILFSPENLQKWSAKIVEITKSLIREKSIHNDARKVYHVDVVRDVINLIPPHFLSVEILGLPIKTEDNPGGVYRAEDIYKLLAEISDYTHSNVEPQEEFSLREKSIQSAQLITDDIEADLARISRGIFSVSGFIETIKRRMANRTDNSTAFLQAVLEKGQRQGYMLEEISCSIFAEVAAAAAPYSSALATLVEKHLDSEGGPRSDMTSISAVVSDNMSRWSSSQAYLGEDGLMNEKFFQATAPVVLKTIFELKNVRKVSGVSGNFDKFTQDFNGKPAVFFTDNLGRITPFPARLSIQYDS